MVVRKPFSIKLDETLMRESKKRAIDGGVHLYEFVEAALRRSLDNKEEPLNEAGKDHRVPKKARQNKGH